MRRLLPWRKPPEPPYPNPARARRNLEEAKARRPEVERVAAELREYVRRNNFAAHVFALGPKEKRP